MKAGAVLDLADLDRPANMEFVEQWLPNTRDSFMNILQDKDGFEIPDAGKGVLEPLGDPGPRSTGGFDNRRSRG